MFSALLRRLYGLLDASGPVSLAPTHVRRLDRADDRLSGELTLIERLVEGDCILCVAGDVIPCCGTVVGGCAPVRDRAFASAMTDPGPSVLRYGASVRAGTVVVSNFLIVRVGDHLRRDETRVLFALLVEF